MSRTGRMKLGLMVGLLIALLAFISGCVPSEGGGEGGFDWTILIFIGLIIGVFYFLMIRPQRKKEQSRRDMLDVLEKGDKVVTIGGIHGQLVTVREKDVVVRVDDDKGVKLKMNRSAISRVIKEGVEADEDE